MKIIVFGVGEVYRKKKDKISEEDEIIAFIDNKEQLQGTKCDGVEIYSPSEIKHLPYEKIVIMSVHFIAMRDQLVQMGCRRDDILYYPEYISRQSVGKLCVYYGKISSYMGKRCLIITNPLGYHGGTLVAVYAAMALRDKGYEVVIASPEGNRKIIDEFSKVGITFVIYPNLQYAKWDELFWIRDFDRLIVNTYPMWLCAIEIAKHRKVAIWLHESDTAYSGMDFWKDIIVESVSMSDLMIYAVSHVARENFFHNVARTKIVLLPYGIPDVGKKAIEEDKKLTFAVIGTIQPIKGQRLFLEAVKRLENVSSKCNFFIIGGYRDCDAEYALKIIKEAKKFPDIHIIGELTRAEMESMYSQIDVVVVASSQEVMSLVVTETMMYGKVCIVSDAAGMAAYIKQRENGLVFHTNSLDNLVEQMTYCIQNRKKLHFLGENARSTYQQYFSMDSFGNRLERILDRQEAGRKKSK